MSPETATVIGAVVGAIIAGVTAYFFSVRLMRQQEFNRAAAEFRTVFVEVQRALKKDHIYDVAVAKNGKKVVQILDADIIKHEMAMILFGHYLPHYKLHGFNKAWNEYYCKDNWDIPLMRYAQDGDYDPQKEIELMKLALKRIDNLLEFAKL